MNRKELIQFLHEYPSIVAVTDHPKHDNLTVEFADGTVTKFNPNMLGGPDDIDILLIKRILHAMDIAIANQELPGKVLLPEAQPLVRSADYFLECGPTTPVAVAWLTDFIGMGLGALRDDTLRIIDETQLPENHDEFDDLQLRSRALENLHAASEYLAVAEFGLGPNIVGVTRPMDNESAWFADVQEMEMAMRQLSEDTNSMWVAIPAHASRFLLVNGMASPAEWHAVLDLLEETMQFDNSIYPVPHIIVDGQWEERPHHRTRIGGNDSGGCNSTPGSTSTTSSTPGCSKTTPLRKSANTPSMPSTMSCFPSPWCRNMCPARACPSPT